jgi:hypothetical protein
MTIGIVRVACSARASVLVSRHYDDVNVETDKLGCQARKALILAL